MIESVLRRRPSLEQAVAWGVVGAAVLFVLWNLYPSLLLRDTTPAYGDLGGHLHEPAFLRDHLLPDWRLSGWSQDWFTGYPSLSFYFPLPMLLVVLVDLVFAYNVALKLVVAAAPLALPLCAYAFGRLNRADRLTSTCLGISVLPLLFQSNLFAAGGSIFTTMTGEFAYQLSLTLGLLVVGLARAGLRTGRYRALTAGLLAATVLMHVVPAAMVVVAIGVAVVVRLAPKGLRFARASLRWTVPVFAVAGLLAGFWTVPLFLRGSFTAGTEEPKVTDLMFWLVPKALLPVVVLAVVGALSRSPEEVEERSDLRFFLVAMAAVSALVFAAVPTGRVGNGRFLAVWYLWLCLLAGYGLAQVGRAVDEVRLRRARGRPLQSPALVRMAVPAVVLITMLPLWDTRLGDGALARTHAARTVGATVLAGYESGVHKAEFQGYIDTVRRIADEHGCGRAHFEWAAGTWAEYRISLQFLTPYWTDGCIPVTWGIYVQSSATSPALIITDPHLSTQPIVNQEGIPFDVDAGVADLRILGVRYFIASVPETQKGADANPDLRLLAQTKEHDGRSWKIYEITGVELVEPVRHLPVVVPGTGRSRASWEAASDRWFLGRDREEVIVAANGPAAWPRRGDASASLPRRQAAATTVSDVRIVHDKVSFRVSRTGVPVLVKVSYFPNWKVSGAEGPWRVTPNQMVVVPTSKTVTLRYGRTPVEYAGWLATLAGVGGLVFLARRRPVDMPEPREPTPDRPTPHPHRGPKGTKPRK